MTTVFTKSQLCPPPSAEAFKGAINHPDVYIWDAWAWAAPTGDWHFYTLASPRDIYKNTNIDIQTQRDHIPHHWRHFISKDKGQTWRDQGCVMTPRLEGDYFDSRSIWTGSVVSMNGKLYAGYTGIRPMGEQRPFLQAVGLAELDEAQNSFIPVSERPLSCPIRDYDDIIAKGYYLGAKETLGTADGEDGQCILAWRDPGMIVHDGVIHCFWGAKSSQRRAQEPVLAYGILEWDQNGLPEFTLMPPIFLPDIEGFTQAEVPQVAYDEKHQDFYLMVSLTDRTSGEQTDGDLDLQARIYRSKELTGPWKHVSTPITKAEKRYPGVIICLEQTDDGVDLVYNAPFNRSADAALMHTMPAPSREKIKSGK